MNANPNASKNTETTTFTPTGARIVYYLEVRQLHSKLQIEAGARIEGEGIGEALFPDSNRPLPTCEPRNNPAHHHHRKGDVNEQGSRTLAHYAKVTVIEQHQMELMNFTIASRSDFDSTRNFSTD